MAFVTFPALSLFAPDRSLFDRRQFPACPTGIERCEPVTPVERKISGIM
jgi:hypothetical protein